MRGKWKSHMSQPSAVRFGQRGTLLIGPFSVLMPCPTWTLTWNTDTASRLQFLPQDFWYRYHNLANSHETESLSARLEIKNTCSIFKNVFNERSRQAFYYPLLNCTIGTLNRHQKEIRIRSGSEISPWILDERAPSDGSALSPPSAPSVEAVTETSLWTISLFASIHTCCGLNTTHLEGTVYRSEGDFLRTNSQIK